MKTSDLTLKSTTKLDKNIQEGVIDFLKSGGLSSSGLLGDKQKKKQRLKNMYTRGYEIFKDGLLKQISTQNVAKSASSSGVQVDSKNFLIIPKNGSAQYYNTKGKWFNVNDQPITKPTAIQYLDNQVDSGNVRKSQTIAENSTFEFLSRLIENKILFEESDVKNIVANYVNNQIQNLPENPEYEQQISKLVDSASKEYEQKGSVSDSTIKKLWDPIFQWNISSNEQYTDVKDTKYKSKDVNNNGVDDHEERTRLYTDTVKKLQQIDINDKSQIKTLNDTIKELGKFISQ